MSLSDDELISRVELLRTEGLSPKQIARVLGVPPARVAPVVRSIAEKTEAATEPVLVGCWVSAGWSVGLDVDAECGWPDHPVDDGEPCGLVAVLVARQRRRRRSGNACAGIWSTRTAWA